jgi:hypothetical protein
MSEVMPHEAYKTMNELDVIKHIATLDGYTGVQRDSTDSTKYVGKPKCDGEPAYERLPNYKNNIKAVNKALAKATGADLDEWVNLLIEMTGGTLDAILASAEDRIEAYVRVTTEPVDWCVALRDLEVTAWTEEEAMDKANDMIADGIDVEIDFIS